MALGVSYKNRTFTEVQRSISSPKNHLKQFKEMETLDFSSSEFLQALSFDGQSQRSKDKKNVFV